MKEDKKLTVFSFHEIYEGSAEIPAPQSHGVQRILTKFQEIKNYRILQKLVTIYLNPIYCAPVEIRLMPMKISLKK